MNPTYRKINLTSFGENQEKVDAAAAKRKREIDAKRERLRDSDIRSQEEQEHYAHVESHWGDTSSEDEENCPTCQDGPEEITESRYDDLSDDDIESTKED
tara:strand:+ start:220 stop:519 length:300 start_codon:yes stop_codon:yes gene_type:complete